MSYHIRAKDIYYGEKKVIDGLNLSINKGEKVAIIGKSGCGKTTLLQHLYLQNKNIAGFIAQDFALVDNMSVFHNVYLAKLDDHSLVYNLKNLIYPIKKEKEIIQSILEKLHLSDKLFTPVNQLSGGQQQRIAIARAIYSQKSILLADEPISALDETLADGVLVLFAEHFETIICSLHHMSVVHKYFDRIIGLKDGQMVLDKMSKDLNISDTNLLYAIC